MAPLSNTEIGAPPAAGGVVDEGGHAVVGGDRQEVGLELVAGADVDRMDLVVEAGPPPGTS